MARHSFIQMSKLPNVTGRISYITSKAKQENLYATYHTADSTFWSNLARESQQEFKRSGTTGRCMIKAQNRAKEIKHLQNDVLPELQQQLADTKGIFKGKERKALEVKIEQTEKEISDRLNKIPDTLKADGYPDVQAFMATFREMQSVVEQYNRDLARWEQQVMEKEKSTRPPEKESIRARLKQIQEQGRQERKPRKKSQDRER